MKRELSDLIDETVLDDKELQYEVTVSKITRQTYAQFFGEDAEETITGMLDEHGFLEPEDD